MNFLSSLVGGDKISGQNDLAVGEDKYEKILTRKEINNKIEIKGRFVVRSLEKHLNYIDFIQFKSIMIFNLFIIN